STSYGFIFAISLFLKGKFREFKYFIEHWQPDIIALQETHLNPAENLRIPNYSDYRSERLTHKDGGTALLFKNSIYHRYTPTATTTFENATVFLHLSDSNRITVSNIFRPPHRLTNTQELVNFSTLQSKSITKLYYRMTITPNTQHRALVESLQI
ncbi:hypothetical protein AVEN_159681-1, partial [Araneus ventricosus]